RPAFLTLRRSLGERGVAVDALQARLDGLFAQAVAAGGGGRRERAGVGEGREAGAAGGGPGPCPPAGGRPRCARARGNGPGVNGLEGNGPGGMTTSRATYRSGAFFRSATARAPRVRLTAA